MENVINEAAIEVMTTMLRAVANGVYAVVVFRINSQHLNVPCSRQLVREREREWRDTKWKRVRESVCV